MIFIFQPHLGQASGDKLGGAEDLEVLAANQSQHITATHMLTKPQKESNMLPVLKKAIQETTMTDHLLQQLKKRRQALGLKQSDMMMRIGVSRQQYQRLEAKGNPRLDTLELIAKGMNGELMLIPKEKVSAVIAVLENVEPERNPGQKSHGRTMAHEKKSLSDAPWQNLLDYDQ